VQWADWFEVEKGKSSASSFVSGLQLHVVGVLVKIAFATVLAVAAGWRQPVVLEMIRQE
jgi:Na+(H+)/acetate symporter ActP